MRKMAIAAGLTMAGGGFAPGQNEERPAISLNDLGYTARYWSVDDGLPADEISAVAQTRDGYLWIATRGGLARFNGTEFQVFRRENMPGLPQTGGNWFHSLCADSSGRLWMGVHPGGLAVYENGSFRQFGPEEGYSGRECEAIVEGPNGDIWIMTGPHDGKNYFRFRNGTFEEMGILGAGIAAGPQGEVWTLTPEGPAEIGRDSPTPATPSRNDPKGAPFQTHAGHVALLCSDGIYTRLPEGWTHTLPIAEPGLPSGLSRGLCESPDGLVWIPSFQDGLWVLLPDGRVRRVVLPSRAFSTSTHGIFCDREGNVWVCSKEGLYQFTPTPFVTWQMDGDSVGRRVMTIAEDGKGRTWFAARGGIFHLPPEGTQVQRAIGQVAFSDWFVVGTPQGGALVANPRGGIHSWRPDLADSLGSLTVEGHQGFSSFLRSPSGFVWATSMEGIFKITGSGTSKQTIELILARTENPRYYILGIAEDSKGQYYVGTSGLGLTRFHPGQPLRPLTNADDPLGKTTSIPRVDAEDRVWTPCFHPTGVGCWSGEEWFFATWDEVGFPEETGGATGLMPDENDGLWVVTKDHGVFHTSRSALFASLSNGPDAVGWTAYDRDDGLASSGGAFNPMSIFRSQAGKIWIGTNQGASVIDPGAWGAARDRIPAPPVVIESVLVDGQVNSLGTEGPGPVANNDQTIVLEPGHSQIEVRYAALNFANPSKVNYRYQLEGFDPDWVEGNNRRSAYYQQVPPGNYRFRVMASNGHGKWNETGAAVHLTVEPRWWQRTDVRVAAVALLIACGFLGYRVQMNRMRKKHAAQEEFSHRLIETQESERKRIASELHDNLGQDLILIKTSSEMVSAQLASDSPVRDRTSSITGLAMQALEDVRVITTNLYPPVLERFGLPAALRAMVDKAKENSSLAITCEVEALDREWTPEERMGIYRIVQECLNNAIKHADAGKVAILAIDHEPFIDLVVQDDGKGFVLNQNPSSMDGGMGLRNIRERARILGGSIHFDSQPEQGSCITVKLPIPPSPPDA